MPKSNEEREETEHYMEDIMDWFARLKSHELLTFPSPYPPQPCGVTAPGSFVSLQTSLESVLEGLLATFLSSYDTVQSHSQPGC